MLFILFSIVTYLSVMCIKAKDIDAKLSVYTDNLTTELVSYNITLLNSEKYNDNIVNINIEGQICFFSSFMIDTNDISMLLSPCPRNSIFLINNPLIAKTLQTLQLSRISPQRMDYKAILFKNDKDSLKMFYQDIDRPFLLIDEEAFDELLSIDGGSVRIEYSNLDELIDYNYLYVTTMIVLVVSFICLLVWNIYSLIIMRNKVTLLQRVLVLLPYVKFSMSCLVIYFIKKIGVKHTYSYEATFDKIYYETIISTISAIYKTLYWFILILLANGWHIFTNSLQNLKLSNYVCAYMTIYLIICIDQVLDLAELNHIDGLYVNTI
jgi:hypothetical protein